MAFAIKDFLVTYRNSLSFLMKPTEEREWRKVRLAASSWHRRRCGRGQHAFRSCLPDKSLPSCQLMKQSTGRYVVYCFGSRGWSGRPDDPPNFMGINVRLLCFLRERPRITKRALLAIAHEMAHERQQFCDLADGTRATTTWTVYKLERDAEIEAAAWAREAKLPVRLRWGDRLVGLLRPIGCAVFHPPIARITMMLAILAVLVFATYRCLAEFDGPVDALVYYYDFYMGTLHGQSLIVAIAAVPIWAFVLRPWNAAARIHAWREYCKAEI